MVWILSPPGVSSAWANSARARSTMPAVGGVPPVSAREIGDASTASDSQRPFAQPLADPAAHLGRRCLGVSEAEDLTRDGTPLTSNRRSTRAVST